MPKKKGRAVKAQTALYMVWPAASRFFDFDGVSDSYKTAAEGVLAHQTLGLVLSNFQSRLYCNMNISILMDLVPCWDFQYFKGFQI
ncbi:hypothetical protein IIC38_04175 [candidate division KSB1 bacterium]|nr:hypothetical protein [candidate division KSB1 bacterium]